MILISVCRVSIAYAENIYTKEQKNAVEKILLNHNKRDCGKISAQEYAEDLKL